MEIDKNCIDNTIFIKGGNSHDIYAYSPEHFEKVEIKDQQNSKSINRIFLNFCKTHPPHTLNLKYLENNKVIIYFDNGAHLKFSTSEIDEIIIYKIDFSQTPHPNNFFSYFLTKENKLVNACHDDEKFEQAIHKLSNQLKENNVEMFTYNQHKITSFWAFKNIMHVSEKHK